MKTLGMIAVGLVACLLVSVKANSKVQYRYRLEERNHAVAGRINVDAEKGDKVAAILDMKPSGGEHHSEGGGEIVHLQLDVSTNTNNMKIKSSPSTFDIVMTTGSPTAARQTQGRQTAESFTTEEDEVSTDAPLPTGNSLHQGDHVRTHNVIITHHQHTGSPPHPAVVKRSAGTLGNQQASHNTVNAATYFVLQDTNTFAIDPLTYFLKVNDTSELHDHENIEFYVVMFDVNGNVVSNPLPFIVYIVRPEPDTSVPIVPAAFAGVLVLCVIFLAVLIPVVTRAKRRYKQGKPLFKLGSHASSVDLDKINVEHTHGLPRQASEPNWYGNNVFYNYEDEMHQEQRQFAEGISRYSLKSKPPSDTATASLQLPKNNKENLSRKSSSSGIASTSQAAEGTIADETLSQRL